MNAGVALTRPDLVHRFAILSGRILPEFAPRIAARERLAPLRALIVHGRADGTLPIKWATRAAELLAELGMATESSLHAGGHELTPAMRQAFLTWFARERAAAASAWS
jgi:phospholipase/carboxylesterase